MSNSDRNSPPVPRKPSLLLPLGAAVLFIVGGAVAWAILRGKPRPGELPSGAELLPQESLISVSISTDPAQWQKLQKFGTPQTRAFLNQNLEKLRDRIFEDSGYTYEQDIQPWVGEEAMLALLPQSQDAAPLTPGEKSSQPGLTNQQPLVMVLPIANPNRARELLANPQQRQTRKQVERTYKDITIQEIQGLSQQNLSIAVLGRRFLAIATHPRAIEQTIDAFQDKTSLAATPGYIEALRQIQSDRPLARIYVNVPAAATLAAANSANPATPGNLAQRQQNQGLAATISLEPDGILFKGISWLKPTSEKTLIVENKARNMQRRFPADTALMISGGNLQRLWQDYVQGATANPLTPIQPKRLENDIQSSLGMDLATDFLPWMAGEFALALIPTLPEQNNPFAAALVIMVQVSDRRAAEAALEKLDEAMQDIHSFEIDPVQLGNQPAVSWTSKRGIPTATRGWLDGNIAFLTLGAPIADTLVPQPANTLAENDLFLKTVPADLEPNNGHFFLDLDRATAYILSMIRLPPGQKILTTGIRSIGVTAAVSGERTTRYDVFVTLKKVNEPPSAPTPAPSPPEN